MSLSSIADMYVKQVIQLTRTVECEEWFVIIKLKTRLQKKPVLILSLAYGIYTFLTLWVVSSTLLTDSISIKYIDEKYL